MKTQKINIFIVDDHPVVLSGLTMLLKHEPAIEIIDTATNGADLIDKLVALKDKVKVHVILMDINMPVMDGLEATRSVKELFPDTQVVMLTVRDNKTALKRAIAQGANGFLSKNVGRAEIIDAIKQVHYKDEFVIAAELDASTFTDTPSSYKTEEQELFLTEKERQIICMITQEISLEDIMTKLSLSQMLFNVHYKNIKSKLGVNSDIGIVREALSRKLCDSVSYQN